MGNDDCGGLPPGHRIAHYRIERELGRGGFGITYRATDEHLDRHVALKEYFPCHWAWRKANYGIGVRRGCEEDFRWGLKTSETEARVLARIHHPNVVKVYAYHKLHGTGYMAMEYIEGQTLQDRLEDDSGAARAGDAGRLRGSAADQAPPSRRKGTLLEIEINHFVLPIMDGLEAVHEADWRHRDVKPANIMLERSGRRRGVLIDFGAARSRERAASGQATIVHTPGYAAYEQLVGEPEDEATDIYSLGAVLYHCVTGNKPQDPRMRDGDDRMPRAVDAGRGRYTPGLLRVIDAALAVRSNGRPKSVEKWRALLATSSVAASSGDVIGAVARDTTRRILIEGTEREVRELAEDGDMDAQYRVGCFYADGVEVGRDDVDDVEARFWFRRAAAQGHLRAHYRLHRMSADGVGGRQDRSVAADWETKAWQADPKTQCRLGVCCREEGADDEAEFWYRGAAYQGDVDAQFALGTLNWDRWVEGKIVDAGVEVSLQWCMERAEQGSSWADVFLAGAIDVGIAGGSPHFRDAETEMKRFTGPYTTDSQESLQEVLWHADCATFCLAYKYLRMAARQGHPEARDSCDRLGVFMLKHALDDRGWHHAFLTDLAVESMTRRDDAQARCRVEDGELLDRFRLVCGVAYETTKAGATIGQFESEVTRRLGCSKEGIRRLLRCCWAAACQVVQGAIREQRSPEASLEGILSPDFCGTPAITSAIADLSNADYRYERGLLAHYENEWEEAESWFTRAAEQGHAKAQFDLGMMCFHGEIEGLEVGECVEHAVSYCIDAAGAGLDCAKAFLERDIKAALAAYRRGDHYNAEIEFRRLAELDHAESAEAQFRLAQMCIHRTVSVDLDDRAAFDQACEWLRGAARNGCGRAESWLYGLLGGHVRWWLDIEQVDLEDLGAEGLDWYWKAAERTPAEQYDLGLHSEGDPDHACREEAAFWYRLAAERGHIDSQVRLRVLTDCGVDAWHLEDSWLADPEGPVRDLANVLLGSMRSEPSGQQMELFPSSTDERPDGED